MCYGYDGHAALDAATERAGMGRRKLLAGALGTAAVGALGVASTSPAAAESTESAARWGWGRIPPHRISIQLYSIREDLEKNYKRSLRYVAETGYPRVEQAGYYGHTARELRRFHRRIGVWTSSSHDGLSDTRDELEVKLENANTLGQRYIVVPYLESDKPDDWKKFAWHMNSEAAAAQRAGLRYGYHNHAHEFMPLSNGQRPWDIFMAELDPWLVHLEVDLYWIATGGVESGDAGDDIEGYINEHIDDAPLRVRQYHVKDRDPKTGTMCDLGKGNLDFPRIFANHRVEEYIMENDEPDVTPRQTTEVGYEYLRKVRF